jgi:alpha-L-arabinofuranosidase
VASGSSNSSMPTFGSWEATVLEHCYDLVDYISCHAYYEELDGDLGSFLASAVDMDHFVNSVVSTADSVGARLRSRKRIGISFDEWNVWYLTRFQQAEQSGEWAVAPRVIEDEYNVADAVVVGSLLISLLRHADRVTVACLAQLANVIAPIRSEPGGPAWRQTTFHPFATTARLATGNVLRVEPRGPSYETARYGPVSTVDAVATYDEQALTVFAVNRDLDSPVELTVDLRAFDRFGSVEACTLTGADLRATNTQANPDRVGLVPLDQVRLDGSTLTAVLPRVSWTAITCRR